jgi:lipopolysaccharide/colanic/teichoic acid biosynthesis glycosyltransferase
MGLFDTGSPIFLQERVGRDQKPFTLVKFRTMRPDTDSVASHLADAAAITPLGAFLRRTKLDELPQLWNVLKGEMSLVGPRPCLFNQTELIIHPMSEVQNDIDYRGSKKLGELHIYGDGKTPMRWQAKHVQTK